jgi:hypothetical protein
MKTVLNSKKERYLARVSIFLIAAVLIAGMAGCGPVQYNLTISSTEGGEVTNPGEGTFTYDEGTLVDLVAEADEGYLFVNWIGNVNAIANVYAASTTITMNGDYSITANFAIAIEIRDWYDLNAIGNNLSGSYILMNDLDSTTAGYEELASETANEEKGWQPIGTGDDPFTGAFDGQGHEIHDLFINRPDEMYVGLFGYVDDGDIIKNLGVVNATVIGREYVGGLVGYNEEGNVSNSYFTGSVTGTWQVGGLVGRNDGVVSNSHSSGSVISDDGVVGGLVGSNSDPATVSNSYSTGNVSGNWSVGGLMGENDGTVSNSYASGTVVGTGESVGGLIGSNVGPVSNSYATGSVIGVGLVGGLVGYNFGTVGNSYYNYDEVLINGENIITIGALFDEDFEQWLANDKFLDINDRLSQEDGYYVVNNIADFKELLAFGQDNSLKFRLKNELDLAIEPDFYIPYLAGEFDGNGHKVSNLSFNFDFVSDVGLFGYLAPGGKVTDLGVENVNITGDNLVGGLVGNNREGTVSHCYATGNVTGVDDVGGLVGHNYYGTVSDSYAIVNVIGYELVGGLVAANGLGTVSDSYATGSVIGTIQVGGLVGRNGGTVSNAYATGSVTGNEGVGGLVGKNNYGTVSNSYSTGSVIGNELVGGLAGENRGTVSNSFWDTETSGQATSAGGTGKNTTEMKNITTFSGVGWNIIAVANPGTRNLAYIWNIVNNVTYPFLSWQPV